MRAPRRLAGELFQAENRSDDGPEEGHTVPRRRTARKEKTALKIKMGKTNRIEIRSFEGIDNSQQRGRKMLSQSYTLSSGPQAIDLDYEI
jgi:hypothetical protein